MEKWDLDVKFHMARLPFAEVHFLSVISEVGRHFFLSRYPHFSKGPVELFKDKKGLFPKDGFTWPPCPHSHWLRRHRVPMVKDYANTMSTKSSTMLTSCLHNQRLVDYYKTWPCNQRLRWHSVIVVNDYTNTQF